MTSFSCRFTLSELKFLPLKRLRCALTLCMLMHNKAVAVVVAASFPEYVSNHLAVDVPMISFLSSQTKKLKSDKGSLMLEVILLKGLLMSFYPAVS